MIELFIIIIVVGILIYFQISLGRDASNKIKILQSVFTSDITSDTSTFRTFEIFVPKQILKTITWAKVKEKPNVFSAPTSADDECIQVITIETENKIAKEIENSINTYLLKNKGAVSDFNLIKDIVERNCDAVTAEVESITPMPLYFGLAGTMMGIVVGLGVIGMTTGFNDIQAVVDSLMTEVALAMIASLVGVLTTTSISWKSRKCNASIEATKNKFYTWIQTELLPVLSSNTVSTLTLLERNLTKFNSSFGNTIIKLDEKLSKVGETYGQQLEILRRIEQLDMTKMATANVKILKALDSSSQNLQEFAQYMDNSTIYLSEVRKLTRQLDAHLKKTESLDVIAEFYKKQMNEIALRQDAIKSSVVTVDDVLQKALASLQENTETGLSGLKQTYVKQQDEMERLANLQGNALTDKLKKIDLVVDLISGMQDMPKLLGNMEKALNNVSRQSESASLTQVNAINNLAEAIRKNRLTSVTRSMSSPVVVKDYEPSKKKSFFSKFSSIFKRNTKVPMETKEDVSVKKTDSENKGKWYEQGKQKRIIK